MTVIAYAWARSMPALADLSNNAHIAFYTEGDTREDVDAGRPIPGLSLEDSPRALILVTSKVFENAGYANYKDENV